MGGMRVLIGYEESHRAYGETAAEAIRWLRPGLAVSLVRAEELGGAIDRLDPHLVVCNRTNAVNPSGRAAWARLSTDPEEPSEFCLCGRRRPLVNPGFRELLAFVDEAEEQVLSGRKLGGC